LETNVLSEPGIVGQVVAELDRLVLDMRDTPSTSAAIRRLCEWLGGIRRESMGAGWGFLVDVLRGHDVGRLLRTDPMVRRCQWRPAVGEPYDIVEAFVMGWDDATDSLLEAEPPGLIVNTVFLAIGLAAAMRERRAMVHAFLPGVAEGGPASAVLGLGAGRAPETAVIAPDGPLAIEHWIAVDPTANEDAILRRRHSARIDWRTAPLSGFLDTARGTETFDLIYVVDALDTLDDRDAAGLIERAAALLRPNGKLIVSAFAPNLPDAAYMDAALDWRPMLRGEAEIEALFKAVRVDGRAGWSVWRGGTERVVFGVLQRLSWTG
jgi:SAM-dependent methyltransferase